MVYTDAELAVILAKCRATNQAEEQPRSEDRPDRKLAISATPRPASLEQMAQLECAIKEQQAGLRSGGWRALAKQLEEEFREEFGDSKLGSDGASADPQRGVELLI